MSTTSTIEWTDATWNPVRGCVKVSPGCAHCYAETFAERFRGVPGHPYEKGFDLRLVPEKLTEPLSWRKPRRIFVNSMSDLFQDGVPDGFIFDVFAMMERCPQHTFQVLTKRPERMLQVLGGSSGAGLSAPPLPNVWLGVSVENQHFADERIPLLLQTPAAVRFISAEPLLEPVDLTDIRPGRAVRDTVPLQPVMGWPTYNVLRGEMVRLPKGGGGFGYDCKKLDWVIVGGESGPGARPFDLAWAVAIVAQCQAAGVPVFVKQLGTRPILTVEVDTPAGRRRGVGQLALRDKKGGAIEEWPIDLRVREFPEARA